MSDSLRVLIRDGLATDIPPCLELDADFETERVWQMHVQPETSGLGILFRPERLPREMIVPYEASQSRLKLALDRDHCFLVALEKNSDTLLGYLTLRADPVHKIGQIQDIVVTREFRRCGIGSRLLRAASAWASEKALSQITVETQTKNYPAIQFCEKHELRFCGFNDQYFRNGDIAVFFSRHLRRA